MKKYGVKYRIGSVAEAGSNKQLTPAKLAANDTAADSTSHEAFGDLIPYADPSWYQGYHSPYYNETHVALRQEIREWVEEYVTPNIEDWEEEGKIDPAIYKQAGELGILTGACGLPEFTTKYSTKRLKSVKPEEFDAFHELVIVDEICRCGSGAFAWFLLGGLGIGLPPLFNFGQEAVKQRVIPGILAGDKRICLCITEPDAGSDVANIRTSAKKTEDGKHYIVNGVKKWITNGIFADYFSVAVRTGKPGMGGISMLLIERTFPGITTRKIKTQGMGNSGSTYIEFDNVKVPVENIIGKENQGFKVIMSNFNHERIGIIIQANRFSRLLYEEAVRHAHRRKTFGKRLIEHDVIRNKLANMAIRCEGVHNWLESLVYQTTLMDSKEAMFRLGGAIAGAKALATQTMELCAREASQIFGGLSYTRGGQGGVVERLYREVRAYAIPGGSEEIMLDLAMRQALKVHEVLGSKL
ncbi:hypothetical protein DV454_002577 [Geotrichum candidum]|nr:hypothetical protein DV454_002577 [Geotrichum candidum]